ncbi:MAG: hypothetical protein JWM80_3649 [Cyanobacteria bacterium RYN_339]|nr:hypothetical protein [Cyanobacteria bacterium RYN_339]
MPMTVQAATPPWLAPSAPIAPPAGGAAYSTDAYYPAAAPVQAQDAAGTARWLGWLGGLAGGLVWAIPKLRNFGPVGFLTGLVVALGCAFYGGKAVEAGQELLQAKPRAVVEVGAWLGGATLAAKVISTFRQPGALLAAAVIWLGSWAAAKALSLVWPKA